MLRKGSSNGEKIGVLIFFSFAIALFITTLAGSIPVSTQWPMFEALRTTAAVVTGVVGIWLGVLYPEEMRALIRREDKDNTGIGDIEFMSVLLNPLRNSLIILMSVVILGLVYLLVKQIAALYPFKEILRLISLTLLIGLTTLQVYTVLFAIVPIDVMQFSFKKKKNIESKIDKLLSKSEERNS